MAQKIGILGYGEVGQAIAKFYKFPLIKDLDRDDTLRGVEVLHICIPWSSDFLKIAIKEINKIHPNLTIIHSTVEPGTTKRLAEAFEGSVVHSPIRGMHPDLYPGIKTFVKYIGADDIEAGVLAQKHLESVGMKTKLFYKSITTEIGKLLDTTYYGLCIAWHAEMNKMCENANVKFKEAVTEFNETYNEGYKELGINNVIRPVLTPPEEEGITGQCVVPNAEILKKDFKSPAINLLLKYKPK